MPLDLSAVGAKCEPQEFKYTWKDVVLYALGIGATKDELDYLYEAKGPKVYPSFAVVPAFQPMAMVLGKTGGNPMNILHGGEAIRLHKPIPAEGTMVTVASLDAIYDMKKMAQAIVTTKTEINGELVCETTASIIYRGEGGFDGEAPPKADIPKGEGDPTWTYEEQTSPEQALLYRLSGDMNPLHADPDLAKMVGFPAPILHGLCTYGYVCRAVINKTCDGDASKLKYYSAQFRKPVWPGDQITTAGWDVGGGKIALQAMAGGRPDPVISNCWAEIA